MERYRRGERDRDDPSISYFGAGESYRPGAGRSGDGPPRPSDRERPSADSWNSERRDERRDPRREEIDSYIPTTSARAAKPRSRSPGTSRRRSRSPALRGSGDTYNGRARSPPRRFSPRRDERQKSPPRRRSRSPAYGGRPRSPPDMKRGRDYSMDSRRSPPPAKRERLASPGRPRYDRPRSPPRRAYSPPRDGGRAYRPRSRTPPRREDRKPAYADDNWRRRSPSPRVSGPGSNNTSRRSSPPIHPDRASIAGSVPRSPGYPTSRSQHASRHVQSPPRRDMSPRRSPPRSFPERVREPSPAQNSRRNGDAAPTQPPTGPGGYRSGGYDRPPPSGPSRAHSQSNQMSPPSGPSSQMSMSAHNRPAAPSMLAAPTRPRGAPPGRFDGPARDFAGPPAPRGRGNSMTFRGSGPRGGGYQQPDAPSYPPRGGSYSGRGDFGRGDYGGHRGGHRPSLGQDQTAQFPFRSSNNSSSTTYPRTQRFNTTQQHLSTMEKVVTGGRLLPSGLPPEQEKRIKTLEAEAERMRLEIEEKQKVKREALREWEVRERESEREGLKSELAEESLRKLTDGENGMSAAF